MLVVALLPACSTKKNTLVARHYHNLTAHYNIYFNASEIFREGMKKVETNYTDNFNTLLPLEIYTQKDVARRLLPDMDKTIKKCSKVITMHSITSKPKRKRGNQSDREKAFYKKNEFNKWVDDSYLLMGKAYYYKHDNFPAIQNFEYVIRQYPEDGLKHEANLWLAKTHIALKNYDEAENVLNRLEADPDLPDNISSAMAAVRASLLIEIEEYEDAINQLMLAIQLTKKKQELIRYNYILAQLFEQQDELTQASLKYEEVIDLNPDYRMAFNAKINRARLYEGDAETGEEIRKQLNKMLRDDKNLEFLDQIYYAIAELDMKQGLEAVALDNYKLSAQSSYNNTHQQCLSYLAIGQIYYKQPNYLDAQTYLDSCLMVLPDEFPERDSVEQFGLDVSTLGQNLRVIHREDSLQAVAALSEEERETLIKIKIDEAKRIEEERMAQEEAERLNGRQGGFRMAGGPGGPGRQGGGGAPGGMGGPGTSRMGGQGSMSGGMSGGIGGASSQWYFYNPSTLSYGQAEFSKLFGRRKLEDNWRRSNKGVSSAMSDLSTEGEEGDIQNVSIQSAADQFQPTTREYYLADLPLNDTLIKESNDRIELAHFNVGKVFKDELNKADESVDYFNKLLNRFPETDRKLFTYYNLYQIYKAKGDTQQQEHYKSLILRDFPDSRSAKIISNPNYFQEIDEIRIKVMDYYTQTYLLFIDEQYEQVISNCENADTAFALNPIRDKFGLLQVMSMGAINPDDKVVLANRVNDLLFKYPESEIRETANTLLDILENGIEEIGDNQAQAGGLSIGGVDPADIEEGEQNYAFNEDAIHYYIAVVSRRTQDLNRLNFNISNFNIENYDQDFFEVSSVPLNDDLILITVKNFQNSEIGMNYYYSLLADPEVFSDFDQTDFRHFIISKANYNVFYRNQNVFKYIRFFREHYLDEEN